MIIKSDAAETYMTVYFAPQTEGRVYWVPRAKLLGKILVSDTAAREYIQ